MKNKHTNPILFLALLLSLLITTCSKNQQETPEPENQYLTKAESVATVPVSEIKSRAGIAAALVQKGVKVYQMPLTERNT